MPVPVEAMYAGAPVIAVASGGPLETVLDGASLHGYGSSGHRKLRGYHVNVSRAMRSTQVEHCATACLVKPHLVHGVQGGRDGVDAFVVQRCSSAVCEQRPRWVVILANAWSSWHCKMRARGQRVVKVSAQAHQVASSC